MNALELAAELDGYESIDFDGDFEKAAAMLRNLHTENTALRCTEIALRDEIAELRRQLAARVPDGWKLVPENPTPEMKRVGGIACGFGIDIAHHTYSRMLEAAPSVEQTPADEWTLRGTLARLKCWHRLTESEAEDLMQFAQMLSAAPAQPEPAVQGEPVAWHYTVNGKVHLETRQLDHYHVANGEYVKGRPLVFADTRPQQASKPGNARKITYICPACHFSLDRNE